VRRPAERDDVTRTVVQYVDSDVFGGSEQVLLQLLAGLDRAKWRPVLLHHPEPGLARLVNEARASGVPTRAVARVTDANVLLRLPGLLRAVGAERPAVFHAHLNWPLACKFGLVAAAFRRVPAVVATVHLFVEGLMNRNVRFQMRAVGAAVDRYLAVSEHVRNRLAAAVRLPERKLRVVPNGIDPAPFARAADPALRARLAGSPDRPLVFTAARLSPQKGLDVLVSAAALVPEALFVVAGEGPERAALEARAEALAVARRVRFLGARDDVPELLAVCDLFVLPSLVEGLPLSVLEAMAAAKPVVATRIGGTVEAVVDGETGILVPPGDASALATAIRSLLADPVRARRTGEAGRDRLRARFTAHAMVGGVSAAYDEVLNQ
jgi:glycosyltransferase involved in cell wall biosynthesis